MRRNIREFIKRGFRARRQDYLEIWLSFTERLATCSTAADVEKAILGTYAEFLGVDGALFVLDRDRQRYVPAGGRGGEGIPSFTPLTAYFLAGNRVYDTREGEYRPTDEESRFITGTGADLVVPLVGRASVIGLAALKRAHGGRDLGHEDRNLLKTLANQAALALINYRLADELVQVREMNAVARLSSFVIHDLKNLAHTLTLVVNNARSYIAEPEFQKDMISSLTRTADRMKELIQKVKVLPDIQDIRNEPTDVDAVIRGAISEAKAAMPRVEISYRPLPVLALADGGELHKVITNLILNALEALPDRGLVEVETALSGDTVSIGVRDNGCGMSEEFMLNNLFKPFRTTKKKGLGIGLYQCKQIMQALKGRIEAHSEVGKGSTFTVHLLAAQARGGEPLDVGDPVPKR